QVRPAAQGGAGRRGPGPGGAAAPGQRGRLGGTRPGGPTGGRRSGGGARFGRSARLLSARPFAGGPGLASARRGPASRRLGEREARRARRPTPLRRGHGGAAGRDSPGAGGDRQGRTFRLRRYGGTLSGRLPELRSGSERAGREPGRRAGSYVGNPG